jgi:VCBS repeat-containing protein
LNYSGKFDAKLPFEGPGAPHHSHIHVDSVSAHGAPVGAIVVPDAQLLFNGDFKRSGVDLILSRDDRELVLQDYFKGEKRAALSSPDGAHLTGDIIDALTGHQQFAQAGGGASAGKVIGHLTKLIGSASAIRNGVSIILNNGDNVEKGDVVQSGSNSTVGITFIDGTVFGLSSNARMVLNEMVYDPNGSNNSSLLSLVAGTISFVAGETAKHGDMKVDTPVATMGIRGTAVLVEIDFDVTGQGGAPAAKFQVLVEPDGTTGRYVLFDKVTLAPIATVDQAGVVKSLSQGILTSYSAPLSADVQKLITDVFSLKFSDNTNTKTQDHQFTDSIVPQAFTPVKLADGSTAVPIIVNLPTAVTTTTSGPTGPTDANPHIPGPPAVFAVAGALIETIGVTNSSAIDTASGIIRFADLNAGDTPTVKTKFGSFTYQDAQHHDVTATLSAQQLADIAAVEANLVLVPDPGNKNTGSVTWTYSIVDSAFDFIAAGETLTLTYIAQVDNNFAPNNETAFQSFTITITRGANDVPTIVSALTTATGAVTEDAAATLTATGTITYQDVDLTDTHTAAFVLKSSDANANLPGYSESAPLSEIGTFALGTVNENTTDTINIGSVGWTFKLDDSNPVLQSLAVGQTITQVYTVTIDDGHGGTVSQDVTVTITGTNDAPTIVVGSTAASGAVTEDSNVVSCNIGTSGTIGFQDVDLIDTHTASFVLKSTNATADLPGFAEGNGSGAAHIGAFALGTVNENTADTINVGSVGWSFTLDDSNPVLQSLAVGQTITQVYTVTVSDGHGGTVSQDVTVTITGTNDAPTIVANTTTASGAVTEDSNVVSGNLVTSGTIGFNDVDLIDTHTTCVVADDGNKLGGTLTMGAVSESAGAAAGTVGWTYKVADDATDYLAAGQTATEKFTVTIDDGHGGKVAQVVTITVTGTNEAPDIHVVTTDSAAATLTETNAGLSVCGTLTVNDADVADTVSSSVTTVTASGAITGLGLTNAELLAMLSVVPASGLAADPGNSHNLTWTFNSGTQAFNYLAANQSLVLTYTVQSTDSTASPLSDTQLVTVTIYGTNDAPDIHVVSTDRAATTLTETNAGLSISGTLTVNDADVADTVCSSVTTVTASGAITGLGLTNGQLLAMLSVAPASGLAADPGDSHNLTWTFNSGTQAFNYLAANQSLVLTYTVQSTDSSASPLSDTQSVTVTINGANDAPVITSSAQTGSITERANTLNSQSTDTAYGTVKFTDADLSDTHTVTVTGVSTSGATSGLPDSTTLKTWLSLGPLTEPGNGATGSDPWTFSAQDKNFDYLCADQTVKLTYTVQVADNHGGTTTQNVDITITGTNDAPKILSETDPVKQTVVALSPVTPIILAPGVNENALGLHTETFDSQLHGPASNNGQEFGNFTSATLGATFAGSGHAGVVNGTSLPASSAPFVGPGVADATNYLSIGAGGTETITFAHDQNAFGLYWGSVDTYNSISFYHGATLVASYTGANVAPLFADGNRTSFSSNGYVEFAGLGSFDKVVLASSSNAFEIDNISAGNVPASHVELAAPITGTLSVSDADIGDTLTASVIGDAVIKYNGSTALPGNANVAALKAASAITFDSVQTNGGVNVLHWTYDPENPDLDFLKSGDTLTISFTAQVKDGHGSVGSQALTITIGGANPSANMSEFKVVNGTSGNDTFNHVGNNVTIFGAGGHDTFVFNAHFGSATIGDFDVNDSINVDQSLFATVTAFVNAAHSANSDHDTIITDAAHDTITLKGVTLTQFLAHQGDYHVLT